jgi:signal transduction histidine kinase
LTQVGYARQQIDRHLAMARVAATAQDKAQRCAVQPVLEGLVRVMERVHPECRFRLLAPESAGAVFRGEAQDLQEMVGNLLDNAGKWAKTEVQVRVNQDATLLYLDIDDDGPGVAVAQRSLVLKRGRCADEDAPGSGLGLAIVEDLAELYGGRLELLDGSIGGLRARLTLPAWRAS